MRFKNLWFVLVGLALVLGCNSNQSQPASVENASSKPVAETPVFKLAWSEYPSWSAFGVASEEGIINGKEGELSGLEKKYNVDVVLVEADYDTCTTMYGSGSVDATCITNIDVLQTSLSVPSTAILPTSTSHGADAMVTVGVDKLSDLKGVPVYGLEKSVSQYTFVRNLEEKGFKESDFTFKNQDPEAAAQAMQQGQEGYKAIVVWNPFMLQTLRSVPNSKSFFDSTTIPGEIIDMVVCSQTSLKREGGDRFARCVCETFYELNKMLVDPAVKDTILVALGAKFSNLSAEDMAVCLEQTQFYKTPAEARKVFESPDLPVVMKKVVEFCESHKITDKTPTISYDGGDGQLVFTTRYFGSAKK